MSSTDRDRILSEFIDAWNAGRRPDVDDYLARAEERERGELADALMAFLRFAPTPEYSDEALAEIRADPIVAPALAAAGERAGLLPTLFVRLRARLGMSNADIAGELVSSLSLPGDRAAKTEAYLGRLERGELEPSRISGRVFDALARLFGVPRAELEGAGDVGGWAAPAASAAAFRASDEAADAAAPHLDLLAKGLSTPGDAARDEVDDLFLGGR
ncbi:MAG: helix-turn-helix transcriptional regulator [Actinobacteria bacterium]|nr:MAG: helix-turn-helix transcriptional regulator [Actinomycetota bacterium]